MIPFYKIISLLVRSFSKPLIAYAKKLPNHATDEKFGAKIIRRFFIRIGNTYHYFDVVISRKFMKLRTHKDETFIKPLTDETAIQSILLLGAEFFAEILLYSIMIGFPVYEMYRASIDAQDKKKEYNDRLSRIEKGIEQTKNLHNEIQSEIMSIGDYTEQIQERLQTLNASLNQNVKQNTYLIKMMISQMGLNKI